MEKLQIIEALAREQAVERIVATVLKTGLPLTGDAADLAQLIYVSLLTQRDGALEEVAADPDPGRMRRYLAGAVMKQVTRPGSRYDREIRRFNAQSREINETDINSDIDVWERRK